MTTITAMTSLPSLTYAPIAVILPSHGPISGNTRLLSMRIQIGEILLVTNAIKGSRHQATWLNIREFTAMRSTNVRSVQSLSNLLLDSISIRELILVKCFLAKFVMNSFKVSTALTGMRKTYTVYLIPQLDTKLASVQRKDARQNFHQRKIIDFMLKLLIRTKPQY